MRFLAVVAGIAVFALLVDRAASQQAASAAGLSEEEGASVEPGRSDVGAAVLPVGDARSAAFGVPSSESPFVSAANVTAITAIRSVFGARAPAAIRVARCETGGTFNPNALGRAGERGIFQLHPVHRGWIDRLYGWHRMFEPLWNARAAYRLSRGGTNWRPWTCRP